LPPAYLHIAARVRAALAAGRPAVALESTVIAHRLPWPENRALALRLQGVVRAGGAGPADDRIIAGRSPCKPGRGRHQATARAKPVRGVNGAIWRRARAAAGRATTVAGTIWVAERAGIRVMATGGIGGVHRASAGMTFDVSADLPEIARTAVVIVCAGAKAILDLAATCEWLETAGVPVLGYGTDEFPAFYSAHSGLPVDERVETPEEVAAIARAHWAMGLGGLLVVVPPPAEHALEAGALEAAIDRAHDAAARAGARGKELTPFLLARVSEYTDGHSLAANWRCWSNARVAAALACAMAQVT
jgi:pseudouridine-5'-phosphate glycosidase